MFYFPDVWWRSEIVSFYYNCLNENAHFRSALGALFRELAKDLEALENLRTPAWQGVHLSAERWPYRPIAIEDDPFWQAYNATVLKLSGFCERWHLPTEHGIGDLEWSCRMWRFTQKPVLIQGGMTFCVPNIGIPIEAGTVDFDGVSVKVIEHVPAIFPNVPLPFTYDPIEISREKLNERIEAICREIRESILAQAEAYERQAKEAGFKPRPPRLTPQQMERIARAIYRRAVFGWTWEEIYREYEGLPDNTDIDAEKVRSFAKLIRGWAKDCHIPLE